MNKILWIALMVALATPVAAQSAIRGVELSPTDAARVDRQCDALRFRMPDSLAASTPDEPPPGEIVSDPSSYWATTADGMDAALAKVNLDTLSVRDCREAGFYE